MLSADHWPFACLAAHLSRGTSSESNLLVKFPSKSLKQKSSIRFLLQRSQNVFLENKPFCATFLRPFDYHFHSIAMLSGVMQPFFAYLVLMCCLGAIASPVRTRSQFEESQSSSRNIIGTAYFTVGYKSDNWKLVFKTDKETFFYALDSEGHAKYYSGDHLFQKSHQFWRGNPIVLTLNPQEDASLLSDIPAREMKAEGARLLDESEQQGAAYATGPEWVKAAMARLIHRQASRGHKEPETDTSATVEMVETTVDKAVKDLVHIKDTREKDWAEERERLAKLARQGGVKQ
ncbi:hypothetical protein FB446DRAFT_747802 [Lentinula raphanica]|nr:hypothetical protein FB446DRAFT_747802 [Lentinula raphanica]